MGKLNVCKPDAYICSNHAPIKDKGTLECSDGKHFVSNCIRDTINNGNSVQEQCNLTYNKIVGKIKQYPEVYKKKYAECKIPADDKHNPHICELLNKTKEGSIDSTVHWGNVCTQGKNIISHRAICKDIKGLWEKDSKDNKWKCYDKKTNAYLLGQDLCGKVGKKAGKTWSNDPRERCIIETDKDETDNILENICTKWSIPNYNSDISFTYHKSENKSDKGYCKPGDAKPKEYNTDKIISKDMCEKENNTYKRKYSYSNVNFCPPKNKKHVPDENLNWTGGEIQSDGNNNWKSDCSSSILNTCQVACDTGYGGGGDYVCHYNNHSDEVCKKVEKNHKGKQGEDLEKMCNRYVNCMYDPKNKTCSSISKGNDKDTGIMEGQMEWLGPECYKLNNAAFAHGIYNYPTLDEVFPPLMRLFTLLIIAISIILLLFITGIIGPGSDVVIKFIFESFKKFFATIYKGVSKSISDVETEI